MGVYVYVRVNEYVMHVVVHAFADKRAFLNMKMYIYLPLLNDKSMGNGTDNLPVSIARCEQP